jgi:hypothetical protein
MIYPMYAMVLLTLGVGFLTLFGRFKAVKTRAVSIKYFRAMQGPEPVPEYAAVPARHFGNLFEVPVLFYAVCLAAMVLQMGGPVMTGLAWAFVICRVFQAFIHLTYNNILHRMTVFFAGFAVVFIMWTLLVVWGT